MKGIYLENLTWVEAEEAFGRFDLFLIPLGARCKEHGHHLPLNNDWRIAEYLTRRALEQVEAIALPTLQYGFYPSFLEYPGSVSLSADAQREVVVSICQSIARQFKALRGRTPDFYVINTGISTIKPLELARDALAAEGIPMRFLDLRKADEHAARGLIRQARGTHADEVETSMMLYIAPETVRMELARKDDGESRGPGGLTRDPSKTTGVYSPTGAWGDPTLATLEKGRIVVEGLVKSLCEDLASR